MKQIRIILPLLVLLAAIGCEDKTQFKHQVALLKAAAQTGVNMEKFNERVTELRAARDQIRLNEDQQFEYDKAIRLCDICAFYFRQHASAVGEYGEALAINDVLLPARSVGVVIQTTTSRSSGADLYRPSTVIRILLEKLEQRLTLLQATL